jgi:hypothetical protein
MLVNSQHNTHIYPRYQCYSTHNTIHIFTTEINVTQLKTHYTYLKPNVNVKQITTQ